MIVALIVLGACAVLGVAGLLIWDRIVVHRIDNGKDRTLRRMAAARGLPDPRKGKR